MLILHVPHASTTIPELDRVDFCVDDSTLQHELLRMTDWYSDELYAANSPAAQIAQAAVSRLVVDVERFAKDEDESCAKFGMGATYTSTTDGKTLRVLTQERRQNLLENYYWPHHHALDAVASEMLAVHGRCTILDAHTFPVMPLPMQQIMANPPEIGIGTDAFHTLPQLRQLTEDFFRGHGFLVSIDEPFKGALVPNAFYGKEKRVQSVMIEVRRDLYMDEASGQKSPGFSRIQRILTEFREVLAAWSDQNFPA